VSSGCIVICIGIILLCWVNLFIMIIYHSRTSTI